MGSLHYASYYEEANRRPGGEENSRQGIMRQIGLRPYEDGCIIRTQVYAVYADHFAHVGRVFSATNAHLRRSYRVDAEYIHFHQTPDFYAGFCPPFEALLTWQRGCWIVIG